MRKIIIEIPETKEELKEFNKYIIEIEKGSLEEANEIRKMVNWEFSLGYKKPLLFQFCCETCKWEGGAFWHCHIPQSPKCHINVDKNNLCKHYIPNWGLMTFLWYRAWREECKFGWGKSKKFLDKLKTRRKE